jgi:predicted AlkP superfamily phosphohydrolase/phosphomutase
VIDTYQNHVDDDPLVLVASDHGFQPHVKRFNLGNWLVENDYFVANDEGVEDPVLVRLLKKLDFTGRIQKLAPRSLKQQIGDAASEIEGQPDPFDWEASTAYSVGRSNEGFIYILDENRSETVEKMTEHLYQIKDPETGDAVVQTVHRKEDVYDGDDLTIMPDLILEPEPGYSFTGGYSPEADLFYRVTPDEDFHLGKHHPDGMMIFDGSGIVDKEVDAELLDLTPTLLHYFGIQSVRELDGTVRTEVFDDTIGEPEKVVQVSDDESDYQLSEDEEQAVEERLEELGYR